MSGFGLWLAARAAGLLLLTEAAAAWLLAGDSTFSEAVLARALFTLFLATVLQPQPAHAGATAIPLLLLWSLLSGASLALGLLWLAGFSHYNHRLLPLAGGTALLVFLFACLRWSLAMRCKDRRIASQATLATLILSLTLPLWSAPLAVLNGASKAFVDSIVALCPLSYLAALAEVDYLRSDWMYQYAPYGSLRFDYPAPAVSTLLILLLATIFIMYANVRRAGPRTGQLPAIASPLLEMKP